MQIDFGGGSDVAFFRQGWAGIIRLTRPQALNALNQSMTEAIGRALFAWARDIDVALILLEGEGRAFCAGGDVVSVWQSGMAGGDVRAFFAAEYRLNSLLGRFPKPCLAFLDGFVMGGGAGLSMHGSHRLVTENTRFAMPEAAIGFFPDVGMGVLLAKMEGHFGLYLALTGARIRWGDCMHFGLATHAIRCEDYPVLRQSLIEDGDVNVLKQVEQMPDFETLVEQRMLIARCFAGATVAEIIANLERERREEDDFAASTIALLRAHAPTSLEVIHKHIDLCQNLTLDECLELDYRVACHMLEVAPAPACPTCADFYEGVRARLIDRDNSPHWQPIRSDGMMSEEIAHYFAPLPQGLVL